ncbi:hypothetical protein [Cuneatibacter caecimuris]|uniref:Uncharacterized protein n=1 Tax=Cuneatibacter caecimuris TaxID=1796618 RepID=A0A4Q7PK61_9FIRM|nr:hypothetical protein [Cuneatibacter caecimuris]RZT00885.1 hypothetical protein EV209_1320 [Cuneatibacter caecimuris]
MKIYLEKTNGNNLVIITDGKTAKIFDGAPTGTFEGVDLYTENTVEELKKFFAETELNEYNEIHCENEVNFEDIAEELETAEQVLER